MIRFGLALAGCLSVHTSVGYAGPFGFEFGAGADALRGCSEGNGGMWNCPTAPDPHPEFEFYIVQYTNETGICFIKGVGNDIRDNRFGSSSKIRLDEIRDQISLKYGEATKTDFLVPGALWSEPDEWLMSLRQKERFFAYEWPLDTPIDGVTEVYASVSALNSSTGYVVVEFYSEKNDRCDEIISNDEGSSF